MTRSRLLVLASVASVGLALWTMRSLDREPAESAASAATDTAKPDRGRQVRELRPARVFDPAEEFDPGGGVESREHDPAGEVAPFNERARLGAVKRFDATVHRLEELGASDTAQWVRERQDQAKQALEENG